MNDKVILLSDRKKPKKEAAPTYEKTNHSRLNEEGYYWISNISLALEMALVVTGDKEVAQGLLKYLTAAVNQNTIYVSMNIAETRKYADYLEWDHSPYMQDWITQLAHYKAEE